MYFSCGILTLNEVIPFENIAAGPFDLFRSFIKVLEQSRALSTTRYRLYNKVAFNWCQDRYHDGEELVEMNAKVSRDYSTSD